MLAIQGHNPTGLFSEMVLTIIGFTNYDYLTNWSDNEILSVILLQKKG
jgi:hypothetical protein